ncbi:hypothetical protein C8F04DRAFT_1241502 [Mycena alexandri]|uniref:Uncharacterized protein n=1 Tax=Mycena alexandri TaxID=1745969 RepID=A0AAD6WQE2_9AGAR|nr:hypothetical protein C8F04DRAFT_1241502 [Mycena alexandri]
MPLRCLPPIHPQPSKQLMDPRCYLGAVVALPQIPMLDIEVNVVGVRRDQRKASQSLEVSRNRSHDSSRLPNPWIAKLEKSSFAKPENKGKKAAADMMKYLNYVSDHIPGSVGDVANMKQECHSKIPWDPPVPTMPEHCAYSPGASPRKRARDDTTDTAFNDFGKGAAQAPKRRRTGGRFYREQNFGYSTAPMQESSAPASKRPNHTSYLLLLSEFGTLPSNREQWRWHSFMSPSFLPSLTTEMCSPRSTPTANPLHENILFAPGGYLHEGTSDTQVFGFSESQSRSGAVEDPDTLDTNLKDMDFDNDHDFDNSRAYSQGDPANPYDPASPQYPAAQAYLQRCIRSLPPSPPMHQEQAVLLENDPKSRVVTPTATPTGHRIIVRARTDVSKAQHLARLAALLSGSQFADGEPAIELPMLKRFGGAWVIDGIVSPETIKQQTDHEREFLRRFSDECWQSSPADLQEFRTTFRIGPNAFQRESLLLFRQLVAHLPLLVHTVMDPDRAETMSRIIESMGRIVHGLQLLAKDLKLEGQHGGNQELEGRWTAGTTAGSAGWPPARWPHQLAPTNRPVGGVQLF